MDELKISKDTTVLSGLRICLAGTFSMPTLAMNKRLRQLGVEQIDRVTTSCSDTSATVPPIKESTNLFVIGKNVPEDCIKRYELNSHDGYKAVMITEQQLYALMRGEESIEIPKTITKHIDLDYSYYEWNAPVINGRVFTTRVSSPMKFNMTSVLSPVARKEIYLPDMDGLDMAVLRQIIGNLGGYANTYYDDKTDVVLLSAQTINNWKNGIKDHVILELENRYNNGPEKMFNVQFASEADFMTWVSYRLEQCPDPSTIALCNRLK